MEETKVEAVETTTETVAQKQQLDLKTVTKANVTKLEELIKEYRETLNKLSDEMKLTERKIIDAQARLDVYTDLSNVLDDEKIEVVLK